MGKRLRRKGIGVRQATAETINRDIGALKTALTCGVKELKILETNPLADFTPIKVDKERRAIRRLYPDEVIALRKALDERETRLRAERRRGNAWREKRDYPPLPNLDGVFVDALPVLHPPEPGLERAESSVACCRGQSPVDHPLQVHLDVVDGHLRWN